MSFESRSAILDGIGAELRAGVLAWPFVNFLRAYGDELFVLVPFRTVARRRV